MNTIKRRGRPLKYPDRIHQAIPGQELNDRQREIVAEAIKVMREKGFRGTTIEDVAVQLNLSKAAIYYHIRNKEELLYHIFMDSMRSSLEMAKEIAEGDQDSVEKLRIMIYHWTRNVITLNDQFRVFFEEKHELLPDHQEAITNQEKAFMAYVKQIYADGVRQGCFADLDPAVVAHSLVGICSWTYRWYRPDGPLPVDEVCNQIFQIVTRGTLTNLR